MTQNPHIEFTYVSYLRFKAQFVKAIGEGKFDFTFDGHTFVTDYARYVVQYLDDRYKAIIESEKLK